MYRDKKTISGQQSKAQTEMSLKNCEKEKKMKYIVVLAVLLATVAPAHAYIDAGSGSYMIQMAMAGILAFAFTLKLAWNRVKAFFSGLYHSVSHQDTYD